MFRSKDDVRNVARSASRLVDVEGVQKLNQAAPLWRCEAKGGRQELDALAAKAAHEAQSDIEPDFERSKIDRQQDRRTFGGIRASQADVDLIRAIRHDRLATFDVRFVGDGRAKSDGVEAEEVESVGGSLKDQRAR